MDRIPRLQPHRSEDALHQVLQRTHRCPQPRPPDRQTAEIHIRIAFINRFNALGTAEIVRLA